MKPCSRRKFLLGASGAVVAAPLLPTLARRAGASPGVFPRRFVCLYTGNGALSHQFTFDQALAPLAAHRGKVMRVTGPSGVGGHYAGHTEALTGRPATGDSFSPTGGPSLDQLIAQSYASETPLPSLELGVQPWTSVDGVISFTASGLPIPPLADPRGAFDRVYAISSEDPEVAAHRRAQKLSVLDRVMDDYTALQGKLSPSERRLLDEHLTLLREQEQRLLNPVSIGACDVGSPPVPGSGSFTFPETSQHHLSTLAAALRCDVTRVATLVFQGAQDTTYYTWAGSNDSYHSIAHGEASGSEEQMLAVTTWHASQVAALLDLLDSVPEGDGTLLDHTLVFWTNELGLHQFSHDRDSMGVVLAGATDVLRVGEDLDLQGYLYQDLLLTLAHAMGQPVASFGDEGSQLITEMLL
jgi:hypothetical protein